MTRQTRKEQKRQFWVIWVIVFLGFLGISMPYLIFPPLFLNPEYAFLPGDWGRVARSIFLGSTLAAYPFGQFLGSPVLGALSDEHGRKSLIVGSLVFSGLANIVAGFSVSSSFLTLLIVSRFIAGFMEGNIAIARAMCADFTELPKQKTLGRLNAASAMAYLIGPLIGAIMTDKNLLESLTISTPFYAVSVLFFVLSFLAFWMLKKGDPKKFSEKKSMWERFSILTRMRKLFHNKKLQALMIASTCFTLGVDIFYEFGPVYLTAKWLLEPSQLILYNGVLCLGLVIGNGWFSAFISSRIKSFFPILYAMGTFAVSLLLILFTETPLYMGLSFFLCGISIGLVVTLLMVTISNTASSEVQGEVLGIQVSLRVLGDGFICLFGGFLLILSSKIVLGIAILFSLGALMYSRKKLQ